MAAVRSRATFVGLWATQTSALIAVQTLVHHGSRLFWMGIIWAAVTALGLVAAYGGAHGQKFRPKLARNALIAAGVVYMAVVLSVSSWMWIAVYGMAITQVVRNASLRTEQDFQLACAVPMVLVIFSVGHVTAHWGVTRYIVFHLAALQFTLIAHHAEQRFDAHTARHHTRWLALLSFLSMLAVLTISALLHLWLTQPPGLHAQLVPAQAMPKPGADGSVTGAGAGTDPSWLDAVRALLGDTVTNGIRSLLAGLDALTGLGGSAVGSMHVPSPWFVLFVLVLFMLIRRFRVLGWARSGLELLWLDLRLHRMPPRAALIATWDCLERILARLDIPRPAAATHHEHVRQLRGHGWSAGLPFEDAAHVFARARYGATPVTPGEVEMGMWLARGVWQRWWMARLASLPRPPVARHLAAFGRRWR